MSAKTGKFCVNKSPKFNIILINGNLWSRKFKIDVI